MAKVGSLLLDIRASVDGLRVDMQKSVAHVRRGVATMQRDLKKLANFASAYVGVEAFKAFATFAKGSIDAADKLSDLAQTTGVSAEKLSAMQFAAKMSGSSAEALNGGLIKLQSSMAKATDSGSKQARAFAAIGVATRDSTGAMRGTDAVFADVAEAISELPDGAEKSALAMQIFGKSGAELVPVLNNGKEGLASLSAEAASLGLIISTETANSANEFNDQLDKLEAAGGGLVNAIAAGVVPSLSSLTGSLLESASNADFFRSVQEGVAAAMEFVADFTDWWRIGLQKLTGPLLDAIGGGNGLASTLAEVWGWMRRNEVGTQILAVGFKSLSLIGLAVATVFKMIATRIARFASALANLANGDFRQAGEDLAMAVAEPFGIALDAIKEGVAIVGEDASDVVREFKVDAMALPNVLHATAAAAPAAKKGLGDVAEAFEKAEGKAKKVKEKTNELLDAMVELSDEAEEAGKTEQQRKLLQLERLGANATEIEQARKLLALIQQREAEEKLADLRRETSRLGLTDAERAGAEVLDAGGTGEQAAETQRLEETKARFEKVKSIGEDVAGTLGDGFANMLFVPFDEGIEGMLESFKTMIGQMVAELIKLLIMRTIFAPLTGGTSLLAPVPAFADGGLHGGVGGPRGDKNFGLFSPGEFTVNARQTRKFLPLLDAINRDRVPGYADGGLHGRATAVAAIPTHGPISMFIDGRGMDEDGLSRSIGRALRAAGIRGDSDLGAVLPTSSTSLLRRG